MCPLSSFTRQRASGSTSSTTPSNSSISSLAMHSPRLGTPCAHVKARCQRQPLNGQAATKRPPARDLPAVYGPGGRLRQVKTGQREGSLHRADHATVIRVRLIPASSARRAGGYWSRRLQITAAQSGEAMQGTIGRIVLGFIAAAISVVVVHEGIIYLLNAGGYIPTH